MIYEQSKNWDMCISANELLSSKDKVLFDFKYRSHKSDNGYGKFAIYTKFNESDTGYCIINIDEDGLVYNGTTTKPDVNSGYIVEMSTEEAYKILVDYEKLIKSKESLENKLRKYTEDDCINIIFKPDYIIERMNK